ncbi:DMT family transporter [Salibacterium salarium]|uniref:DMT family transporter n=1 Tax=Salibacterium salarium TaxID=284579 RepID=A0A428MTC1_9BACI|nr:DMT family transporter [Salibacterium salarium]RSL29364.1 DMT family transporter [Salibacterium salarium]
MKNRVVSAYVLAVVLWASAFPGIRVGLESFHPLDLSLLRLLIGSLGLFVFACVKGMPFPEYKDIPIILLLGFLGFSVYHTFLSIGEMTVVAGAASLLVTTTPLFSAILSAIFLKESFGKFGWMGSIIAFIGVTFITLGTSGTFRVETGILIILIGALGESFYFVFQSSYLKKYGFLPFTTYTIWAGTLFMLIFSPGIFEAIMSATIESTLTVVYLGLFPTVVPYFAIAYVTSQQGASEATSSLYLTPVAAIIISWIWLGEVPTLLSIGGGMLTLAGVFLTNVTAKKI